MKLNFQQIELVKDRLLAFTQTEEKVIFLDSNNQHAAHQIEHYEFIAGWGVHDETRSNELSSLTKLRINHPKQWILGYISYDLKNQFEKLNSGNPNHIGFPLISFFVPKHLLVIDKSGKVIEGISIVEQLLNTYPDIHPNAFQLTIKPKVSKADYIKNVSLIIEHICAGDMYEMNYCVEFYSENTPIQPQTVYQKLKHTSPTPFGAFVRDLHLYLMCASPERFICKKGNNIYSQPIKGTIARGNNESEDESNKHQLLNSEKERAENLMICDLVRNDLSRACETGSIQVNELFGIYSFKQVHQMISTLSGNLKPEITLEEIIRYTFPMGSMTGAPKIKTMELIEQYENSQRGLYSGAVGYINPNGDFDFNVVIRSIQYNSLSHYTSYMVGSAITFDSNPEEEYQECLLKAKAMIEVLENK
jgi:para-aminobenzoate synthetase component 1